MSAPNSSDLGNALLQLLAPLLANGNGLQNLPLQNSAPSRSSASAPPSSGPPAGPITHRFVRGSASSSSSLPPAPLGHPNLSASAPLSSLGGGDVVFGGGANRAQARFPIRPLAAVRARPDSDAISLTNAGRRVAIQNHQPAGSSSSQLVARQPRRTRGAARHPPATVNTQALALQSVHRPSIVTQENTDVAVRHIIFAPTPSPTVALPQQLWNHFFEFCSGHSLTFDTVLDRNTSLRQAAAEVITHLQTCGWRMGGPTAAFARLLRSDTLPLVQVLRLNNRGTPRADGSIMLSRVSDLDFAVHEMLAERAQEFAKIGRTIRDKHLHVFWVMVNHNVSYWTSVDGAPERNHSCIPSLQHAMFCAETTLGVPADWTPPECESGGESDDESQSESRAVEMMIDDGDAPSGPSTPTPLRNAAASSSLVQLVPRTRHSALNSEATDKFFAEFTPPVGDLGELHRTFNPAESVFDAATDELATVPHLLVQGLTIAEMADSLRGQIASCVPSNNFDLILSKDRTFRLNRIDAAGATRVVSEGIGLEREVVYTAFAHFTIDHAGEFLLQRADNFCSIATTASFGLGISDERKTSMTVLGVLTSLMVIHRLSPLPLTPGLILLLASNFDLRCFTKAFLDEWHPELSLEVGNFLEKGATGDISAHQAHFSTYHGDLQVAQLRDRTEAQHLATASAMIYHALIGPHSPDNDGAKAFYTGVKSRCSSGFDMVNLYASAPSGTASFLGTIYATSIQSPAAFLQCIKITPPARTQMLAMSAPSNCVRIMVMRKVLGDFLEGTGVPIQSELDAIIDTLNPLVQLNHVHDIAFRSRIVCQATTGSPHVPASDDLEEIKIHFVLPTDQSYLACVPNTQFHYKQGNVLFHTCFRTAYIPYGFLVELCARTYPAVDENGNEIEPLTLQQAVDNWLFLQFVNGVGRHSLI
ncbi:hypothetical protein C8F01DRAFT_1235904 [Mycena amicta]|nr:hypothetical protein C8F01DRAFT_1235904 [Mycena amicta]